MSSSLDATHEWLSKKVTLFLPPMTESRTLVSLTRNVIRTSLSLSVSPSLKEFCTMANHQIAMECLVQELSGNNTRMETDSIAMWAAIRPDFMWKCHDCYDMAVFFVTAGVPEPQRPGPGLDLEKMCKSAQGRMSMHSKAFKFFYSSEEDELSVPEAESEPINESLRY